jgi:RNA polymerase sigma-70 factor (ECF subfamily)
MSTSAPDIQSLCLSDKPLGWETDDRDLLDRIAAQDQQAFDTLYNRYAPRVSRYLIRFLGSSDLIDDILQEVMLVLWRRPHQCPPTVGLGAWLCGVARNKARKAVARRSTPPAPSFPSPDINEDEPEGVMMRREHGRHVARAVDTLPISERTALTLLVEQGWSYQDIAAATGDPVSTVRTRVSRARQRLRASFAA